MAVKMRQCISCGASHDGREMFRIVKSPEGMIFYDATGRASGRGAYLCKNEACVKDAFKRKGFERSLHMKLPDEDLMSLKSALFEEMDIIEE